MKEKVISSSVISSLSPCVSMAARLMQRHALFSKYLGVILGRVCFASQSSFELHKFLYCVAKVV